MFRPPDVAVFSELFFEGCVNIDRNNNWIYKHKLLSFISYIYSKLNILFSRTILGDINH